MAGSRISVLHVGCVSGNVPLALFIHKQNNIEMNVLRILIAISVSPTFTTIMVAPSASKFVRLIRTIMTKLKKDFWTKGKRRKYKDK